MAIIGSINDGLRGDSSVLLVKATLDGVSSIVLGATMGPGVIFSAIPVALYQGSISLLAGVLAPVLQGGLLRQICAVGFVLVCAIGVNFFDLIHIKTANFLPALLVPPLWAGIQVTAAQQYRYIPSAAPVGRASGAGRRVRVLSPGRGWFSTFFTVCVEREACYGSRTVH